MSCSTSPEGVVVDYNSFSSIVGVLVSGLLVTTRPPTPMATSLLFRGERREATFTSHRLLPIVQMMEERHRVRRKRNLGVGQ